MLNAQGKKIMEQGKSRGWIMEPEAKTLLRIFNFAVPAFLWTGKLQEAEAFAAEQGFPLAMKIVSSSIVHKSEAGGVVLGIDGLDELREHFDRFRAFEGFEGVLLEEMVRGSAEVIIGSKTDPQFGPVVLLGIGGTGVEIYNDAVLRMAPLTTADARFMIESLKGKALLTGFRGSTGINIAYLQQMLIRFSNLVMDLDDIASIDLNPVICSSERAVIADARFILKSE